MHSFNFIFTALQVPTFVMAHYIEQGEQDSFSLLDNHQLLKKTCVYFQIVSAFFAVGAVACGILIGRRMLESFVHFVDVWYSNQ